MAGGVALVWTGNGSLPSAAQDARTLPLDETSVSAVATPLQESQKGGFPLENSVLSGNPSMDSRVVPVLQRWRLDLTAAQFVEWEVNRADNANEQLRLIAETNELGRILVEGRRTRGDIWSVERASILGEYIVRVDALPYGAWERAGYFANGFVRILETNELLARIGFDVSSLQELPRAEAVMRDLVRAGLADRNGLVYPAAVPDDPGYAGSWTLGKLELEPVWEHYGFSPEAALGRRPVIAVIDNGAPADHPDLHLWINTDEIPGNGLDDDANGFIDDVYGYNFYRNNTDLSPVGNHGQLVSEIASSLTNNATGTASPASSAALMRVIFYEQNVGSDYAAANAILYAINNGADVINCSFISTSFMAFMGVVETAYEKDVTIVAAAGNDGINLDDSMLFPVCLDYPNVIGVGASDSSDARKDSNYSSYFVRLFAPGSVTSYSTPLVSSAVALLKALKPEATSGEIAAALAAGVDPVPALEGLCLSGGRLNVRGAVEALLGVDLLGTPVVTEPPQAPVVSLGEIAKDAVSLAWTAAGDIDGFEVHVSEAGGTFAPLEPSAVFPAEATGVTVTTLLSGTEYTFRVRSLRGSLASAWVPTVKISTLAPCPVLDTAVHAWSFDAPQDGVVADEGTAANGNEDTVTKQAAVFPLNLSAAAFPIGSGIGKTNTGLQFAGLHGGIHVPDSASLNEGILRTYTVALWLRMEPGANDLTSVVFEQGGYWRGLNLILEKGFLVANGWNRPAKESDWSGTALNGGRLATGEWTHVALVLDAGETVQENALHLYVNGTLAASGPGSQLWPQKDDNGIGQVRKGTVFRGRQVRWLDPLQAGIDDLAIWDKALGAEEVKSLVLHAFD